MNQQKERNNGNHNAGVTSDVRGMKRKHLKRNGRKLLAFLMAVLLVLPVFAEMGGNTAHAAETMTKEASGNASALDSTERTYESGMLRIRYMVKNQWTGHQTVEITVENTGSANVTDWSLSMENTGNISGLWNAAMDSCNEEEYIIKSKTYNNTILPGEIICFGYTLSGENLRIPENIKLYEAKKEVSEGCRVEYRKTGDWGTGFQGEITIVNESGKPVEGWSLNIRGNFTVENCWNCVMTVEEDGSYTLAHTSWNNTIEGGNSYIIGFVGTKNDEEMVISSHKLMAAAGRESAEEESRPAETESEPETRPAETEPESKPTETESETKPTEGTTEETTETGRDEEINWEDTTDTDGDGVPDVYEIHVFHTDPENGDTDGDGLPDGYEILTLGTKPEKTDTDENGISDAKEDSDGDGLDNLTEYQLGTSPLATDSDYDGLSDKEEAEQYHTDPNQQDTDSDGIMDGDEIRLGLNPLNASTNGVPDSQYPVSQTVEEDSHVLKEINTSADNPYRLSLTVSAAGLAEHSIMVQGSTENMAFQNESYIGELITIDYRDTLKLDSLQLNFCMEEAVLKNELDLFGNETTELKGIRRFNVFHYIEECNMLLPIETFHDEEKNMVSAKTDEDGIYCLVDMEKWLYGLEQSIEDTTERTQESEESLEEEDSFKDLKNLQASTPAVMSLSLDEEMTENKDSETGEKDIYNTFLEKTGDVFESLMQAFVQPMLLSRDDEMAPTSEMVKDDRPIDMVYVLQTEGTHADIFSGSTIVPDYFTSVLSQNYSNIRVCILEDRIDGIYSNGQKNEAYWFEDIVTMEESFKEIEYKKINKVSYRDDLGMLLGEQMHFREESIKFVVVVPAGENIVRYQYFLACMEEMKKRGIHYFELHTSGEPYDNNNGGMKTAIESTGGRLYNILSETEESYLFQFPERVDEIMREAAPPQKEFGAIVATGYRRIYLKEALSRTSGTDTDYDGLTDWEEVYTEMLHWDAKGNVILPTLLECIENAFEKSYVVEGLERFKEDRTSGGVPSNIYDEYMNHILKNTYILPIHSDPVRMDGDGDGIKDIYDNYNAETMDVRYQNLSPLKMDTIETLYPELRLSDSNKNNNEKNAVYFDIDGNNINMHARIKFINDFEQKFFENGIESEKTYEEVAIEGIKLWNGEYCGAFSIEEKVHYDFVYGLKIKFNVTVEKYNSDVREYRYITIDIDNGIYEGDGKYFPSYGIPHTMRIGEWKPESIGTGFGEKSGTVTMYKAYMNGSDYLEYGYMHTMAHEFGHIMGLSDAYPSANNGVELQGNIEVVMGEEPFFTDCIFMNVNEKAYANDIEMILEAFVSGKWQYYVKGNGRQVSPVIRLKQEYKGD